MIAIVDTGGANLASIKNALERLGETVEVSVATEVLDQASHLILPGVGHAKMAMARLKKNNLLEYIKNQTKPVLGICLGMQILFARSEEGDVETLGLLPGTVSQMKSHADFRVPNMGWSKLESRNKSSLLKDIATEAQFYFVHSYAVPMNEYVTATSSGPYAVPAVIEYKNFYATQFHPEKSGPAGAQILRHFLEMT